MTQTITQSRPVSLETYIALVNDCADHRLDQQIANGSAFHARVLIAKLFEVARKSVLIVSGHVVDAREDGVEVYAYQPVIDRARKFLADPAAKLSLIVQGGSISHGQQNKFLSAIINDTGRNGVVEIQIAREGLLGKDNPHFMIADESAFRVETGEDAHRSDMPVSAFANFGDPAMARDLAAYFHELTEYLSLDNHRQHVLCFRPGESFSFSG